MTGGAGFVRDSINNLKRNRALLKKRKKMAENPYVKGLHDSTPRVDNYDELQKWKITLQKRSRQSTLVIAGSIFTLILLVIAYSIVSGLLQI
jgi:hypothetical protein